MGYLVDNVCHSDMASAGPAYVASTPQVVTDQGGSLVRWFVDYVDPLSAPPNGAFAWVKFVNDEYVTDVPFDPFIPECDPQQSVQDGMALGWLVGSVLIGAAVFKLMQRAMS